MTPVHTLSFETNGGSYLWPQTVEDGETPVLPTDPKKFGAAMSSGYTDHVGQQFEGWYTDKGLTKQYTGEAVTKDTTLYAKWKHTWYVAFNGNGMTTTAAAAGNAGGYNPYTISVPDGGTVTARINDRTGGLPAVNSYENPKKAGFRFDGWHLDTSLNVPFDLDTPVTTNLVLQAKWVTPITVANVEDIQLEMPVTGASPQTKIPVSVTNGVMDQKIGYIGTVAWFDAEDGSPVTTFEANRTYKAKVSLRSTGLSGAITPSSSGPVPTLLNPKELYYWTEDVDADDTENDGFHKGIPAITVNGNAVDPANITLSGEKNKTGNVLSFEVTLASAPIVSFEAENLAAVSGKQLNVTVAIPDSMKTPDKTINAFVALYDKDQKLVSVDRFENVDHGTYAVDIPQNTEGMTLKTFIWDNAMIPITNATVLE
jgi:uncharacterized repeat protein (TIGR02543 family)